MSYYYGYRRYSKRRKKSRNEDMYVQPRVNQATGWTSIPPMPTPQNHGISKDKLPYLEDPKKGAALNKRNNMIEFFCTSIAFIILNAFIALLYFNNQSKDFLLLWIASFTVIPLSWMLVYAISIGIDKLFFSKKIEISQIDKEAFKRYLDAIAKYNVKKEQFLIHQQEVEASKVLGKPFNFYDLSSRLRTILMPRDYSYWLDMTPRQFEIEIGKFYEQYFGYKTTVTQQTGDGGVDVIAKNGEETIYIQCKQYKEPNHMGVKEVNEFWGVCCMHNPKVRGIIVCTSSLTDPALKFIKDVNKNHGENQLQIVSRNDLYQIEKRALPKTNKERTYTDEFNDFIQTNKFIDCNHLWYREEVYYSKEEALKYIRSAKRWVDKEYLILPLSFSDTNPIQIYFVLLVNSYASETIKKTLKIPRELNQNLGIIQHSMQIFKFPVT